MDAGAPPVTPAMVEGIMSRALYFVRRDVCIIAEPKAPQIPSWTSTPAATSWPAKRRRRAVRRRRRR